MKRKLLSVFLAAIMVLQLLGGMVAFAEGTNTITVESAQATVGDSIDVPITITNNPGVTAVEFTVNYPSGFTLTKVTKGNALSSLSFTPPGTLSNNPVNFLISGTDADSTNGTITTLTFSITSAATLGANTITASLTGNQAIIDNNLKSVNTTFVNGVITVNAAPTSSATVTVTAPAKGEQLASTVTCGDSNAYTGTIEWYKGSTASGTAVTGNAEASTVYTAEITLTPKEYYSFADSVSVTVNGGTAQTVTSSGGKVIITKTFSATSNKSTPTCGAPTGLTATYGQTLADVTLTNPAGNTEGTWAWKDSTQSVGNVGTNTFKATFTPTDTNIYATVDVDVSVTVSAKTVTPTVEVVPATYDYTGQAITPTTVTVKDGGTVIPDTEYSLTYSGNINIGTATVTVSDVGGGNYVLNETTATFTIQQAPGVIEILDPATITYDGSAVECGARKDLSYTYTGDGAVSVKWYNDSSGVKGSEISAPTDAGSYWIGVSAAEGTNYKAVDEVTKRFTISPKSIDGASIVLGGSPTYNGTEQTVTVTSVTVDDLTATYSITSGEKGTDAGDYTLTLTGNGNFTGTAGATWTILPASLSNASFAAIDDQSFTNQKITPKPAVTLNNKTLTEGTDFTYTYENNQYVGTGKVNVTGVGNYTGSATTAASFTISPVTDPAVITTTATVTKGGNKVDLSGNVTGNVGTVSYAIKSGGGSMDDKGVYTAPADSGTAVVTVTVAASDLNSDGNNEYTGKTADITVNITDKTVAALNVTQAGCTFGGTLPDPAYTVPGGTISTTRTYTGTTRSGTVYNSADAPTDAGTYTVKVACETATHIYEGSSGTFTIAPKSVTGAAVTLGDALTYNTQSQTQNVTAVTLGGVDILASCEVTGNTATDAGDYTLTVTAKDASNYTGSVTKAYTVGKKAITPTVEGVTALDYTGSQLTQGGLTVKDGTVALTSSDYEVVYGENIAAGTNAGSLTVKAREGGNYSFVDETVTFTINKVGYPGTTAMSSETKFGTSRTIDLTSLLAEGYELGTVTVAKDDDSVLDGTPAVEGTKLTFAFVDDEEKTGKSATIQIPVTNSTNYLPYAVTVTVTVIDKLVQTDFKFADDIQIVIYGEIAAVPASGAVSGSTVTYVSGDPAVATVDDAGNVTALKVGKTTITATASGTEDYTQTSVSCVLQVDKATVTVKAMDRDIYVDETVPDLTAPAKNADYTVTGLVGGDTLTGAVNLKYQLDGEDVTPDSAETGSYDIVISGVSEPEGGNYNAIVLVNGKLTISARPSSESSSSGGYAVSVSSASHGKVTASPTSASKGTKVTLTVKPDDGYELADLVVTDKNGDEVDLTKVSDTKYTFTMPSGKVTVTPTFVKTSNVTPGDIEPGDTEPGNTEPGDTTPTVTNPFVDVTSSAYYYDAVLWAVENGVTTGTTTTTFSPDDSCTRAQMVTFLWRAAGSPSVSGANPFTDVQAGTYYYDAVLWAVSKGITTGTSAATFSPDMTVTRAQTVTFLYRYEGSPAVSGSSPFTDVSGSAYYASAVQWAVNTAVTTGTSATTFSPDNDCTRAQIVTFLYRDLVG